tara:strand:- start:1317 stop:1643 length:327 start_codon:yes stop_codon:yes gene_type:complete
VVAVVALLMYQLDHGMVMDEVVDLVAVQHLKTQPRKLQDMEVESLVQMLLHQIKDILVVLGTVQVQEQILKDLVEVVVPVLQVFPQPVELLLMEVVVLEKPQQLQDLA